MAMCDKHTRLADGMAGCLVHNLEAEIEKLRAEVADTKQVAATASAIVAAMLFVTNTPSAQQFAASILGALPGKVAEAGGDDETL